MFVQPPTVVLLSLSLLTLDSSAQLLMNSNPEHDTLSQLQGRVLQADGKPAPGVHVELDEARTALPITSTYTQTDGTFELYNIPKGDYELVAESPDSIATNPVTVQAKEF